MANSFQKGLGGASSGASVGLQFGGPVGGAIGGAVGFLGGLLGGNDKTPELGDFQFSPDSLKSINFDDVNLEHDNPELYAEIMKNDQILQDMQSMLASRRSGPSASERFDIGQQQGQLANQQAANGLVGTPMGQRMMNEQYNQAFNMAQQRAMQDAMTMQGQVAQQGNNLYNQVHGGQQDIVNQGDQNRSASLARDQLQNDRQMAQYQQDQQAAAASNNMWGGMLSAGLGGIANQNNMMNMGAMTGHQYNPNMVWQGLGSQLGFGGAPQQVAPSPYAPNSPSQAAPSYGMGFSNYGPSPAPNVGFGYGQRSFY